MKSSDKNDKTIERWAYFMYGLRVILIAWIISAHVYRPIPILLEISLCLAVLLISGLLEIAKNMATQLTELIFLMKRLNDQSGNIIRALKETDSVLISLHNRLERIETELKVKQPENEIELVEQFIKERT